jgi:hypothetical protein
MWIFKIFIVFFVRVFLICLSSFCIRCPVVPVSLDCLLMIVPSVFSTVYFQIIVASILNCIHHFRNWLLEKTTNLQQVTDKLYQYICNVVSSTPCLSAIQTQTLVVIGTDCICSYKSNYHAITTRTAPISL